MIVTAAIPMISIVVFALWSGYYTFRFGPRGVKWVFGPWGLKNFRALTLTFRHYVNAIIDMGFPKGMNPLHFSAYYGDIEHLRYVIQFDDIRADDTMENGNTALHLAAQNGFSEICYILARGQNLWLIYYDSWLKNH